MKTFEYSRWLKIGTYHLVLALFTAFLALFLTSLTQYTQRLPYADVQLAASRRMQQAEEMLFDVLVGEGIDIEAEDINRTGLIGPEWTELTSSLGMLEAKRTSLNPNFAALIVRYLKTAGLKPGDRVAFGLSGSFPGLSIAALSAAHEMNLESLVIASYASSMYGGTRRELTTVRMLKLLDQAGILQFQMLAVSPGNNDDQGESEMFSNSRELIFQLAQEDGYDIIDAPDIETSIVQRLELYGEDISCFVNIGGASANIGTSGHSPEFNSGLVLNPPNIPTTPNRGLIYEYAARAVPVIHLLNVRDLANKNGLPFDPSPLPKPGEGGVYYQSIASPLPALIAIPLVISILFAGLKQKQHFRRYPH